MVPTLLLKQALAESLAADTTTLAPVAGNKIHLIQEEFIPGDDTDFTALTEATFTGATAKVLGTGVQPVGTDPETGQFVISQLEPAGGLRWEATALTNLPQTIWGFVETDNTSADTYGSDLLEEPVTLTKVGDFVEIPWARFTLAQTPLT